MEKKIALFIAMTLDGYIAPESPQVLEWMRITETKAKNVIMGIRTYDWLHENIKEWPFADRECYIFNRKEKIYTENAQHVNPSNLLSFTKELEGNAAIVGGGKIIKSFLENQLVDELTVAIAPILLGQGTSLFPEGEYEQHLTLIETKQVNDFVEIKYKVTREN